MITANHPVDYIFDEVEGQENEGDDVREEEICS